VRRTVVHAYGSRRIVRRTVVLDTHSACVPMLAQLNIRAFERRLSNSEPESKARLRRVRKEIRRQLADC
jgi:hypothetical protein